VKIISTSPLSHVVTEFGELKPGSPGPGYYNRTDILSPNVCKELPLDAA
jgi:hypothetical protein